MQNITVQNKQTSRKWYNVLRTLKFNRTSQHAVTIPKNSNNTLFHDADWSIRLVCAHGTNALEYIYYDWDETTGKGVYISATNGTSINLYISDGTNFNTVSVAIPVAFANQQKHITVTYTYLTKTIYLRAGDFGETTQVVTLTSGITNSQAVTLGNNQARTSGLSGVLGLLSIYNSVLTTYQIEVLNTEIGVIPSILHANLMGFWAAQGTGGSSLVDTVNTYNASTNNHGTLVNYTNPETDNIVSSVRVDFYDRLHRIHKLIVELKKLGTLTIANVYSSPTVLVDTDYSNTIDTTGTTTFSRVWNWATNTNHQTTLNKTVSPKWDETNKCAKFEGAQYFNPIQLASNCGTVLIELDGYIDTATLNTIGTMSGTSSATQHGISFGNFTGSIAGETFSSFHGGAGSGTFHTKTAPAAGLNVIAYSQVTPYIYFNTTSVTTFNSAAAEPTYYQLGKRVVAASYFTGNVRKVFIFSTVLTPAQVVTAVNLIKSTN